MASWLLDELPPALANGLPRAGFVRSLAAGEPLYAEGSQSDTAYVVLQGLIRLSKVSPNGSQALVAVRARGELVGQHSALDSRPRLSAAHALTDAQMFCMLRTHFIEALKNDSDLASFVFVGLCAQVRDTVGHIVELLDEDAPVLVAKRIVQLATEPRLEPLRRRSGNTIVVDSISQLDLAGWAGVSQRSTAMALRDLRDRKLVATSRLRLEVLDLDGLRLQANQKVADRRRPSL